MLKSVFVVLFSALLVCLVSPQVAVADVQVTYHITNGGVDTGDKGEVHFVPAGNHDAGDVAWDRSGTSVSLPGGAYDVHIVFGDGDAHKDFWIDNQNFTADTERTVEVDLPLAQVTWHITNGGTDTQDKGQVHYFPAGHHDGEVVSWAASGNPVTIPAGSYDVQVTFDDGDAHKAFWIDGQSLAGTVENSAEVNLPLAQVTWHITNGGTDTQDKGQVHYFPAGHHDGDVVTWAASGNPVTIPAGSYDVQVSFDDGDAHKAFWIDGQSFNGTVEKTVEIGLPLADVTATVTNLGVDTRDQGEVHYYLAGKHDDELTWAASGKKVRIAAGAYDLRVTYRIGFASKEIWLDNQSFAGTAAPVIEMGLPLALTTVTVTRGGEPLGVKAQVTFSDPAEGYDVGSIAADTQATLEAGTYDIHATDADQTAEGWLRKVALTGTQHLTIALDAPRARLMVTVTRNKMPLPGAWCGLFPPGSEGEALNRADSGAWQETDPGTYDIGCFLGEGGATESVWAKGKALPAGDTRLTLDLPAALASLTVTAKAGGTAGASAAPAPNVEFILDASGSMVSSVDGKSSRMEIAKSVLEQAIAGLPDTGVNVALRIYGTQPKAAHDCSDTRLAVPMGPIDKAALSAAVGGTAPGGWTPIATNLKAAAGDLPKGGSNAIVLITDGLESCGGDPCKVAADLADKGVVTRSFVVGFTLGQDQARLLSCVGHYYPAADRAQLSKALAEIVTKAIAPPTGTVTLIAADGTMAAQGALGDKLTVRAGRYDVRIEADGKVRLWKSVTLKGNLVAPLADHAP
ncbi:MAG: VWA domain-containing protein [Rhodobacteraceae bacterium]|nr:VWA domain-containing protein [Paracoccaceae bacterium]